MTGTKVIPAIGEMHEPVEVDPAHEEKFRFTDDVAKVEPGEIDPAALADAIAANEQRRVETINRLVDKLGGIQIRADAEKALVKNQLKALGWKAPRHKAVKQDSKDQQNPGA